MTETDLQTLARLVRAYAQYVSWLCVLAIVWIVVNPDGVKLPLNFSQTLVLYIGSATLAVWQPPTAGQDGTWLVFAPVPLWPLMLGAAALMGVLALVRRR